MVDVYIKETSLDIHTQPTRVDIPLILYPTWKFSKTVTITNTSTIPLTNYPVYMEVWYYDFEDGDRYMYTERCRPDFGDIRFADASGNILDYYILEYYEYDSLYLWVEIPYIPVYGSATITVFYHNDSLTSNSNGANTFENLYDWETGNYDTWTPVTTNGSIAVTTTEPFNGTYSLEASVDGTGADQAYIYKDITNRENLTTTWMSYVGHAGFSRERAWTVVLSDGTTKLAALGYESTPLPFDGLRSYLRYGYYNDGVWNDGTWLGAVGYQSWHPLSMTIDTIDGDVNWMLRGDTYFHTESGLEFNGRSINRISVGLIDSSLDGLFTTMTDDLALFDYAPLSFHSWTPEKAVQSPAITNLHLKSTDVVMEAKFIQREDHKEWVSE